jgi:hypothetical protein
MAMAMAVAMTVTACEATPKAEVTPVTTAASAASAPPAAPTPTPPPAADSASPKGRAIAATGAFQKALKGALTSAIDAGGPVAAVDVCHGVAPALAKQHSTGGVVVGRAGVRLRNQANTTPDWLKAPMASWKAVAGPDDAPEVFEATLDDGTYVYASALRAQPLCLTCHGEAVAADVKAAVAARYPDDAATGFGPGALRGAVWATVLPAVPPTPPAGSATP